MTSRQPAVGTSSVPPAPPAIDVQDVRKTFGAVTAVDGLSLQVQPGEVVALLGPNGAGKTTTVDMLLGLAEPTSGTVRVLGQRPRDAVAFGRVSAVMQSGGLLKDFTVEETVAYTAALYGAAASVDSVLERAGITEVRTRLVGRCSGGEQQRLRFALALLPDPDLLLLDEPTTGMDVGGRRAFWSAIREDARRGRTVVFATHYLEEADSYADRIVVVRAGRVVADGTATEVRALSSGRLVRAVLPGADMAALQALPGVEAVDVHGNAVAIRGSDPDGIARYLLTRTSAHDLEITAQGLDEAFLALTADDDSEGSA
jgi:ABC-2 type transport system ATP-binding protein